MLYDNKNWNTHFLSSTESFKTWENTKAETMMQSVVHLLAEADSFSSSDQIHHWFCCTFLLFLESTQIAALKSKEKLIKNSYFIPALAWDS